MEIVIVCFLVLTDVAVIGHVSDLFEDRRRRSASPKRIAEGSLRAGSDIGESVWARLLAGISTPAQGGAGRPRFQGAWFGTRAGVRAIKRQHTGQRGGTSRTGVGERILRCGLRVLLVRELTQPLLDADNVGAVERVGFRHHLLGDPSRCVSVKETPRVLLRVQAFAQPLLSSTRRPASFDTLPLLSLAPGFAGGEDEEEHDREPEPLATSDGRLRDHATSLIRSSVVDAIRAKRGSTAALQLSIAR